MTKIEFTISKRFISFKLYYSSNVINLLVMNVHDSGTFFFFFSVISIPLFDTHQMLSCTLGPFYNLGGIFFWILYNNFACHGPFYFGYSFNYIKYFIVFLSPLLVISLAVCHDLLRMFLSKYVFTFSFISIYLNLPTSFYHCLQNCTILDRRSYIWLRKRS